MVLAIVLAGEFMAVLDASVVNVAAPSIHSGLHASGAGLQLVIAGYTITYAVLLVTGARLGDLLGHRRVFLAGLASKSVLGRSSSFVDCIARQPGQEHTAMTKQVAKPGAGHRQHRVAHRVTGDHQLQASA